MHPFRHFLLLALAVFLITPLFTHAEGIDTTEIQAYADDFVFVINDILVPALMAIALLVFLWGVFKYFILNHDSDEERATGRQFILWGIIGFAVIVSVWGLVNLVLGVFGLDPTETRPGYPTL